MKYEESIRLSAWEKMAVFWWQSQKLQSSAPNMIIASCTSASGTTKIQVILVPF